MSQKIKTLTDLCQIIAEQQSVGKRVVQSHGVFDLLHVGQATGLSGLLSRLGEYREKDSCQDRDDRNDDQQFNQRKAESSLLMHSASFLWSSVMCPALWGCGSSRHLPWMG